MLDIAPYPSGVIAAGEVLWIEDHSRTNKAYAINPRSGEILTTIDVRRPCDIAAVDGRIWIADLDTGKLVWVDQETRAVGGEITGLSGPCGLVNVEGTAWLAVDGGIARLDSANESVEVTTLGDAAFPGAGEGLWAALYGSGDLARIDPASGEVALTVAHPDGGVEGPALAVGHGAVWVGRAGAGVLRLDPETGDVKAEIAASRPARFLVTADGIWLTSYDSGVVERIDPTTNAVVFRADLGGNINGITQTAEGVWVADTADGRLYLIDLAATGLAP